MEETKTDETNCLYAFLYNSCIHESAWATVSLHYTKEGAQKALNEHKAEAEADFNKMIAPDMGTEFESCWEGMKFDDHKSWCLEIVNVLP